MPRRPLENLTESMFYVLLALKTRPMCGMEIAAFLERATNGRLCIGPATLYTVLNKFEEVKYIEEIAVEGRKRTYRITSRRTTDFSSALRVLNPARQGAYVTGWTQFRRRRRFPNLTKKSRRPSRWQKRWAGSLSRNGRSF